jgi:phosphoglycerate kinase
MKYIDEVRLKGKRVFLRADLNVPLENGQITDDYRIRATLPTLEYALKNGGRVILASHLGRPKKREAEFSLKPVAERLRELLKIDVKFIPDCVGPDVEKAVQDLKEGELLLLENVRFYAEEEKNSPEFAKQLASLADIFILDAFAVSHRAHASTAGICAFVPEKAAGFIMRDELGFFNKALENPKRPLTAIFGGAKVSTKMAAIRFAGIKADRVVIGGAMANTFFVAQGLEVGRSLFEPAEVEQAKLVIKEFAEKGVELLLPVDVVVASELKAGVPCKTVPISEIPSDLCAFDVGPKSSELFDAAVRTSATILWNGPMGAFETEDFARGTNRLIESIAASSALSVVGGGDTDLALHRSGAFEKMSYVSTAGGAFLELLEGKKLPAVEALG